MTGPARVAHRFVGVEGLRGMAAGAVLLSHVYLYAAPDGQRYDLGPLGAPLSTLGTVGVVLFFTLSGFLLYRPFAAALLDRRPRPSLRTYFRNRLLRIFPGYWLALLVTGLLLRTTYLPPLEVEGRSLASDPAALGTNLLLVQGYFPATSGTGIGPAWSLVVELAFYAVLPVLAMLAGAAATRTGLGRQRLWLAALVPAGVLLVLGQLGWKLAYQLPGAGGSTWSGTWHAVAARSFLTHASLFAAGVALAVLHTQLSRGALALPTWWRTAAWTAAPLVGLGALLAYDSHRISENRATLAFSVSCALLLALVVLPADRRSPLVSLLDARPLQWAGLVSYGVFLWHDPLISFLRRNGWTADGVGGFALALVSTVLVTAVIALVSWQLVERPALALKRGTPAVRADAPTPNRSDPQGGDPGETRVARLSTPSRRASSRPDQ